MRESKEHAETFQAVAGVTEEHQRLAPFVGTFNAEVRFWMGPGEPVISTGVMVNRMVLGGRFLRQEFQGASEHGPFGQMPGFSGEGYWGYNTVDKRYETTWVEWNFYSTMTNPQQGGAMEKRTIITLHDDDHHTMEMWFRDPDGPEVKAMEIIYKRQR